MANTVYSDSNACTLVPSPNFTYMSHTNGMSSIPDPMGSSTMGLMMLLSTFQYQAPYMSPIYSGAAAKAGKAAFIESGGQAFQDKSVAYAEDTGKKTLRSIGISGPKWGLAVGVAKAVKDRQVNLEGPNLYFVKTHLTASQSSGNIGLRWDFK